MGTITINQFCRTSPKKPTAGQLIKIEELERSLKASEKSADDRAHRINSCAVEASDCFLSMAANACTQHEITLQIEILRNGGFAEFPVAVDLQGQVVATKIVRCKNQFNGGTDCKFIIDGIWYNASDAKRSKMYKAGFRLVQRWLPAWTTLVGAVGSWRAIPFQVDQPLFR